MPTKEIQIHYLVCVPMTVEVDEQGDTIRVVDCGPSHIDTEGFVGVDESGNSGIVWDPEEQVWRDASDIEYNAGTDHIKIGDR